MCSLYGVTRGGYYAWKSRPRSHRAIADEQVLDKIQSIFDETEQTYGSPRIYQELRRRGDAVGKGRIERLMRENALRACGTAPHLGSATMKAHYGAVESHLHKLEITRVDQAWVGDVTYLKVAGERRYLATVMDRYSRRILGWAYGKTRTVELTRRAMRKALKLRQPGPGTFFHSDKGAEYMAFRFRRVLSKSGFRQSTNRQGRMTDNAHMETWYKTMKTELYHRWAFDTDGQMIGALRNYIDYYNTRRLHSALGYRAPIEVESE